MNPKNPWQTLGSRTVYKNHWIRVRENKVIKPNGRRGIYGVVESPPSVYIVALSNKKEIYLIRQYRYPTKVWSWETPSGSSDGQPPLAAAKRELWEETGLKAKHWIKIGKFQVMNGVCSEWGHIYLAQNLKQTNLHKQKDEGIVASAIIPFSKALTMIRLGKINDGLTIVSLMKVALHLKMIKAITYSQS
ncbi:hypothetical protein A3H10_01595 [Candidatus Uhrbacteria bacterium RIFCSPLOWO2_12_FULL_46_10]|uniref:Nudix hydrolase domain-containing protein n=1 Tax=Candidatus Uhrbacteria bacterium RIFCSPLOWO2_01_FULL_47_25 TaxID=1802402 RepID=A0A1F7UTC0_9BACT|nr:MAG: NUDIX hydrolase [Parcubacteria group bacterium GW2011_GWA2_46_9]OGL60477.1 MAG: hypothetical protein A2752_05260 [Candidatus Uhrbacteria bacterium RIFCSPHIGHO2_01_FULL_46_23]OGL67833.1 MAG: hypothetical protein A3D60_01190 [Candidatus Uhrbacteria bacterium RIFCSPHIGHO2_02_FULL_47_29]OGL75519.1 MAG: hypothetical protein A3E96_03630 [Candidatus Uhrbacteria bacterium RIFCSPHIGHO2_12_FULL_46_13]OGL81550.1 MAG: hypothetical protein A2936_01780 [Candidatus Uhrbacteria bacterium RIFCSPLOWO2_01